VNIPELDLSTSALETIYNIINDTRETSSPVTPASPRTGIFLARLVNRYRSKFDDETGAIRFFARAVLRKELRIMGEGKKVDGIIEEILRKRLGEASGR
jgi:hypothetical protein